MGWSCAERRHHSLLLIALKCALTLYIPRSLRNLIKFLLHSIHLPRSLSAKNSSVRFAQALHYGYFSTTTHALATYWRHQNNRSFNRTKSQSHKKPSKNCTFPIPGMEASYRLHYKTKVQSEGVTLDPVETNNKLHTHRSPGPPNQSLGSLNIYVRATLTTNADVPQET